MSLPVDRDVLNLECKKAVPSPSGAKETKGILDSVSRLTRTTNPEAAARLESSLRKIVNAMLK